MDTTQPKTLTPTQVLKAEAAAKYVRQHWNHAPTLDEIANAVGVSSFHLHRLARQHFGVTLKAMVTALQVENAKRMLLDGMAPLSVAKRCGFLTASHFCSRFRVAVGLPPVRWLRDQRRQAAQRAA